MSKGYKDLNKQAEKMFSKLGFVVEWENKKCKKYVKQINKSDNILDFNYQLDIVMFNLKDNSITFARYLETMGLSREEPVVDEKLRQAIEAQINAFIARYTE